MKILHELVTVTAESVKYMSLVFEPGRLFRMMMLKSGDLPVIEVHKSHE